MMAQIIRAADRPDKPVVKLISLEEDGLKVRYSHAGDAGLIVAYILKPRGTRYGLRWLTPQETEAYWREKSRLTLGAFI
jgi:hypothetical protein